MLTLTTWLLVFVRTGAFFVLFPVLSSNNIPMRMRVSLALLLSLMIAPTVGAVDLSGLQLWQVILLIFKEVSLGMMLGFICRFVFFALQLAGHFISTEIGLQTSTILTPDAVPVDVPGAVLNLLAMMLFLSLDVHHYLFVAYQQTYQLLPIGSGGLSNALFDDVTIRASKLFVLAVQLAAPMMAVSFLVSLVLGMLGRAVPQMNIFFESFAIKLLAGLAVFGFSITLIAERLSDYLKRVPQEMMEVGKLLGGA